MSSVTNSLYRQNGFSRHAPAARAPVLAPDRLVSKPAVIAAVLLFDSLTLLLCGLSAFQIWRAGFDLTPFELGLALFAALCGFLALLGARWAYTIPALRSVPRQALGVSIALGGALTALLLVAVLLDFYAPGLRSWLVNWFLLAWSVLIAGRFAIAATLAQWTREGRLSRRAVIVGGGLGAAELIARLDGPENTSIQILGLFDDRDAARVPDRVAGYHKLGRFDELVDFCRAQRVDLLIVALPASAEERILMLLKQLLVLPIDVRIAALSDRLKLRARAYAYIGGVPFLPVFDKPMSDWGVAAKMLQDRLLATLSLVALAPLMALIALAVKLDSRGPVLFKQTRYGFNNEKIGVYKFRSMYVDQCDARAAKLVTRDDPRVTRVGRFIRKTSLDELPQLFNVAFKGDLALVGPRPHAFSAKAGERLYDEVVEGYFARHRVKPGITGWAQVNGWRGETDTEEKIEQRVAHDLFYIDNWSMLFDLRILALTPLALLKGKNAY